MGRGLIVAPLALAVAAVVEIAGFVFVARAIGGGWTVLAAAVVSVVGLVLLRREGVRAWRRFRADAEQGQPPGAQVTDGLVGLAGALLLAVPGFVSGLLGLLLLVPPGRVVARRAVRRSAERRVSAALAGQLFGPRRVRVRRGAPVPPQPAEPAAAQPVLTGDVVEGEIVEARRVTGA